MRRDFDLPGVEPPLAAWLTARLGEVEDRLEASVASADGFVTDTARHLLKAGGKRFRPLVTLLSAQFGDPDATGVLPAALVVELTHVATLYHDDVMDEATLRRGAQSANARWSNTVAILTGDYLFARASSLVAQLGVDCVQLQAETFARLVQGQLRETVGPADGQTPLDHYQQVLHDKTASLISVSARLGARTAGASPEVEEVLGDFGEQIGVAFQLSDDVLDVVGQSTESGKTPGTDLREGVATLPVLLAQESTDPADSRLLELLGGDLSDDDRHAEALRLLRGHPAVDRAWSHVRAQAESARSALTPLPDIPAKDALASLCDVVVSRTH